MRIYGLTGGIGSGKSEVARRLVELGIPVIDADIVGHEILEPGGSAADAVIAAFGQAILAGGCIDREKLGAVVFDDDAARRKLNAIVHPVIARNIAERCAELVQQGHSSIVIEATLLAEDGQREPWMNGLILVLSSEDLRFSRLVRSRGMDPVDARKRMAAQTPPEKKASLADWVIENNGTLDELRAATDRVADAIRDQGSPS
jgi:dephospho-CoA kinase